VKEARSKGAPALSFESTLNYMTNPDTLTVEAGALGTMPPAVGSLPMPSEDTVFDMSGNAYYDFKLILDQPVFTWGKIYNAVQATREGAGAAHIDTMKMRERLYTEIQLNCQTLHYLKEIELALSKQSETTERLLAITEDSFNNGMILQTEYLDSRIKSREAKLKRNTISRQIDQIVLNLTYLTGRELTPVMIATRDLPEAIEESWQEILKEALVNNKDLAMMRHNIRAEEYKSRIGKGTYYFKPDLAFHMELSYSGSYFPFIQKGWDDENRGNLTLTIALKTPVADFGGLYASSRADEEELKAARASYDYNREQIEKFIRLTLSEMELNRLNIEYYRNHIETDLQIIEQKEREWKSGYGDERDYLMQQISYYSNIISLNQELIKQKTNFYKLKNTIGTSEK
jgi:outer membrane protein TolC